MVGLIYRCTAFTDALRRRDGRGEREQALGRNPMARLVGCKALTLGFLGAIAGLSTPADIESFSVIELIGEGEDLPAARWMKSPSPRARIAARGSNILGVHS